MAHGTFAVTTGQRLFAALDAAEVEVVARVVFATDRIGLRRVACAATRLGNGWLYPLLAIYVVLVRIEMPRRFLLTTAASLAVAFALYPLLKTFLARTRPCDYQPSLARDVEPLDHYSCPSGHAMTAAAFGVTLIFAAPMATPLAVVVCGVIGWSRVALGHHYVSDVVLGTFLGASIAAGVSSVVY